MGRIVLTRPATINALTIEMIRAIDEALLDWREDDRVECVLIAGEGERGFCAGGDVRRLRGAIVAGRPEEARAFWRAEYTLNARIARYPKPIVAVMHGIVMGGGIGLGAHASHRLITADARVAMPEVGIGLAPDVGGAYLLARAPGEVGLHLALTGRAVDGRDAIACGLADRLVDMEALPAVLERVGRDGADSLLHDRAPASDAGLLAERAWIDAAYALDTVEAIVAGLRARPEVAAQAAAREIATRSPHALAVTLEAVRRARRLTLEACLDQDYRVSSRFLDAHDFAEGVRAVVIDKDRRPRWRPARMAAIAPATVAAHFAPVADELGLATRDRSNLS